MNPPEQPRLQCERCGRWRYADRVVPAHCVHGSFYVCVATASCKSLAKQGRRAARTDRSDGSGAGPVPPQRTAQTQSEPDYGRIA